MLKFISILIIPILFIYSFDNILSNINSKKQTTKEINYNQNQNEHKNFIANVNSNTINKMYSEKLIVNINFEDNFYLEKKILPSKKIILNKKNNFLYTEKLISSNWEGKFSDKKILFIQALLPLISHENRKILFERKKILKIKNFLISKKTMQNSDIVYLEATAKKYNIYSKNKHKIDLINEILNNINIIPNSIVIAQAANESGWGSSRFAKEFNALFGQYTYDKNNGVIPFDRADGKKYLIKNFSSINKSVESYFRNLNTHYAYKNFRAVRNEIKNADLKFSIEKLTSTLSVYAKDENYVKTINSIIKSNNLKQFDINLFDLINS